MINWFIKKFSKHFVKKTDHALLEMKIKSLQASLAEIERISMKQSELLAALAGVQSDLVLTVGDTFLKEEKDSMYIQKFILTAPDDDDLIN